MNPRSAVTKAIRAHFYRGSFRQFVTDLTTGHDLIVPAEHLEPHDGLGDALDDVMAMCADAGLANPNYLDELMRHDDAVAAVYAWAAMSDTNLEDVLTEWSTR